MEQIVNAFKEHWTGGEEAEYDNLDNLDVSSLIPPEATEVSYNDLVGKTLYLFDADNYEILFNEKDTILESSISIKKARIPVEEITSLSDVAFEEERTATVDDNLVITGVGEEPVKVTKIYKLDLAGKSLNLLQITSESDYDDLGSFAEKTVTFTGGTAYILVVEPVDGEENEQWVVFLFDETAANELIGKLKEIQEEINSAFSSSPSDLPFLDVTLYRGTAVSSPNDNTCWFNGQSVAITWDTTQIQGNTVSVYILYDNPAGIDDSSPDVSVIMSRYWGFVTETENTGSLTIDPAILGGNGNGYKILIVSDIGYWDMSDGAFNLNWDCSDQYTP
jgi:hypothetical protein